MHFVVLSGHNAVEQISEATPEVVVEPAVQDGVEGAVEVRHVQRYVLHRVHVQRHLSNTASTIMVLSW